MVKVGDKVRVTTDVYTKNFPFGTVCIVSSVHGGGCIGATIDGGDGYEWLFDEGEYEPIGTEETEYNYAEQAAKYDIKITIELLNGNVIIFDGSK